MIEPVRKEGLLGADVEYPVLAGHTIKVSNTGTSYAAATCSCGWKPRWTYLRVSHGNRAVVQHIRRMQRDVVVQIQVRMVNEYRLSNIGER